MEIKRTELVPGVTLLAARTNTFKTALFSVTFLLPLARETATANALLWDVLDRGSRLHPDIQALSAAQDQLYGLAVEPVVRQKGEVQCVGFRMRMLEDAYTLDGAPLLEPALDFLAELLLDPLTEGGVFRRDYVAGEGANLADLIRGRVNDKRSYSVHRLIELMCAGEAYGLDKYGFPEEAEGMDPAALWDRYRHLLERAPVVLSYSGWAHPDRVEGAVRRALAPLLTPRPGAVPATAVLPGGGEARTFTDRMEVTQGKLALGFRTGGLAAGHPLWPAMALCALLYGGSSTSKLFLNVREKLSLCYYAGASLDKFKGLMVVTSGVEFSRFEEARREILAQLEAMAAGDFTDEELLAGREFLTGGWRALEDSQGAMEDYWLGQLCAGTWETPEEAAAALEEVTREQVAEAAGRLKLDTIYYLTGEGEEA